MLFVVVLLTATVGLLAIAHANDLSRMSADGAQAWFWAGFLLVTVPIAFGVCAEGTSRSTRAVLLVMASLAYFVARILYSPGHIAFFDEYSHLAELRSVLATGEIHQYNVLLPSAGWYPGLTSVTAVVVELTGLAPETSAFVVIATARVLVLLAVYLILERWLDSPRAAGIAGLLYAANPNFLYWSNQFAYETLALPLAFAALLVIVQASTSGTDRRRVALTFGVLATAVVVTHHLTAWLLTVTLLALWITARPQSGDQAESRRRLFLWSGAYVGAASLLFAAVAAPGVVDYIVPVLGDAVEGGIDLLTSGEPSRELSTSAGVAAPLYERALSFASVLLLALPVFVGLLMLARRRWRKPEGVELLLALGALLSVAVLPLRLTAAGQETANRSADFLYVAAGAVAAITWLGRAKLRDGAVAGRRRVVGKRRTVLMVAASVVVLAGGATLGAAADQRLSPDLGDAGFPRGNGADALALAAYMQDELGPGRRVVTDRNTRQVLGAYGAQYTISGLSDGFPAQLAMLPPRVDSHLVDLMRRNRIEYVAVQRRLLLGLPSALGIYFDTGEEVEGRLDPAVFDKWDRTPGVSRVYDNGPVELYDVTQARPQAP